MSSATFKLQDLSPAERREFLAAAAKEWAALQKEETAELEMHDLKTVAAITKLDRKTIAKRIPVRTEGGKHLVRHRDLVAYCLQEGITL